MEKGKDALLEIVWKQGIEQGIHSILSPSISLVLIQGLYSICLQRRKKEKPKT